MVFAFRAGRAFVLYAAGTDFAPGCFFIFAAARTFAVEIFAACTAI